MAGLRGIGITLFVFIGALTMTLATVQIITMDSQWHFGQRVTQAAAIESCRLTYYDGLGETDPFIIPRDLTFNKTIFITLIGNMREVEHAIYGQSPSSYFLWFLGFFFMFLILGGIMGYLIGETDISPLLLVGFIAFTVVGAVVSTFIAVFIITIDAQWHLRSLSTQMFLLDTFLPNQNIFLIFTTFNVLGNWAFFEHSVGQSASSYVDWFILFIIIFPIATAVLIWILKRR